MSASHDSAVLDAVLDTWDRSNRALTNLLRAMPDAALDARATPSSPTIRQMCAHLHHERMISVAENAPEFGGDVPTDEWANAGDLEHIVASLAESCARVRDAVRGRVETGRALDRDFNHPVQLVLFLILHDGYHHGQMKLALKAAGVVIPDEVIGVDVWDVWRARDARA